MYSTYHMTSQVWLSGTKFCKPLQKRRSTLSDPLRQSLAFSRNSLFCSTKSTLSKCFVNRCLVIRPMPAPQSKALCLLGPLSIYILIKAYQWTIFILVVPKTTNTTYFCLLQVPKCFGLDQKVNYIWHSTKMIWSVQNNFGPRRTRHCIL